jgi:hypothetical protein
LAATGAGPIDAEVGWAVILLLSGGLLIVMTSRRRPTHR